MERGNTKHGPAHDQKMAHEADGIVRGAPQRAHAEEWRQPEPAEGAVPPMRRADGANPRPSGPEYELRSELARILTKDWFPTSRTAILTRLAENDAPQDLTDRVAALPAGKRYRSPRDVLVALGVNSPETGVHPQKN